MVKRMPVTHISSLFLATLNSGIQMNWLETDLAALPTSSMMIELAHQRTIDYVFIV
jgi:hypothetical protein